MSLITARIKRLRELSTSYETAGDAITRELLREAAYTIEMLLEKAKPTGWISCSERLPEESGYYLTTTMYHEVYCDYWEEDCFNRTEVVTAWMPLPTPYDPQEKENAIEFSEKDAIKMLKSKMDGHADTSYEWAETVRMAIKALDQEPCEDCISRKSIKQKLQEHHDFFVNAYGGFSNLPQNDKSRVDEITNCIAMVVNEPSVTPQPKIGRWIYGEDNLGTGRDGWYCNQCGHFEFWDYSSDMKSAKLNLPNPCPNCGVKMIVLQESELEEEESE